MKRILSTLAFFFAIAITTSAQIVKDPTDWSFSVKKKDAKHYTILIHTTLKPNWHMYALRPGGDGTLIATSVQITDAAGVTKNGGVRELTKPVSKTLEGVDGIVHLYAGKADFAQDVTAVSGKVIFGIVEYQTCNDQMCLPPKKKTFTLTLP